MTRVPRARAAGPADTADRLHSVAIHLLRRLRREDDASGLSAPRLSALSVLVFGGPRSLSSLAAAEQVRPPTMTRLVQALERDGLLRREAHAEDGRSVMLHATAKGMRLLAAGRARRVASLAALLRALPEADTRAIERTVGILERVLDDAASSAPRRATRGRA